VAHAGGGGEVGGVYAVFVTGTHVPAGCFLDIVAPLTHAQAIAGAGRPATVAGLGVVAVPDRGIAVRGETGQIPQPMNLASPRGKHRDCDSIATNAPDFGCR
jgi:hypothetical protein